MPSTLSQQPHVHSVPPVPHVAHEPMPQTWPRAGVLGMLSAFFGLLGAVFSWVPVINVIMGTLAVVLGVDARAHDRRQADPAALIGLVLGAITLVVALVLFLGWLLVTRT